MEMFKVYLKSLLHNTIKQKISTIQASDQFNSLSSVIIYFNVAIHSYKSLLLAKCEGKK